MLRDDLSSKLIHLTRGDTDAEAARQLAERALPLIDRLGHPLAQVHRVGSHAVTSSGDRLPLWYCRLCATLLGSALGHSGKPWAEAELQRSRAAFDVVELLAYTEAMVAL